MFLAMLLNSMYLTVAPTKLVAFRKHNFPPTHISTVAALPIFASLLRTEQSANWCGGGGRVLSCSFFGD